MAKKVSSPREAREHAEKAARKASPWIKGVARSGLCGKGCFLRGHRVTGPPRESLGFGGLTTGGGGVMQSIGAQPFGRVLLLVLAAGLIGYALWKLVQGIMDPEDKGRGRYRPDPARELRRKRCSTRHPGFCRRPGSVRPGRRQRRQKMT